MERDRKRKDLGNQSNDKLFPFFKLQNQTNQKNTTVSKNEMNPFPGTKNIENYFCRRISKSSSYFPISLDVFPLSLVSQFNYYYIFDSKLLVSMQIFLRCFGFCFRLRTKKTKKRHLKH